MSIERKTYMATKRKRGRPMTSHNVSVTPEFREMPDIEKLGRVLLSVAISRAKTKDSNDDTDVTAKKFSIMEEREDVMT